jgi:membrane associated rhomboid family serine protease
MQNYLEQAYLVSIIIKFQSILALKWVGLIWVIHFINFCLGYRLNFFGIWPRRILGIPGIFLAPFLHAHWNHLFFNSIPLFILMVFVLIKGSVVFYTVSVLIIVFSGVLIWTFGRPAIHIGASALAMGYWGYLLMQTYEHPDFIFILLLIILMYYFGGSLIGSFFPGDKRSSWEGHVLGFIAGVVVSTLLA